MTERPFKDETDRELDRLYDAVQLVILTLRLHYPEQPKISQLYADLGRERRLRKEAICCPSPS